MRLAFAIISGYAGMKMYHSQGEETGDLLLQNVEALSKARDVDFDDPDCPGPARFAKTGRFKGETSTRIHINDSTDRVTVYEVEHCMAEGIGGLSGNNGFLISFSPQKEYEVSCEGPIYHNAIIE